MQTMLTEDKIYELKNTFNAPEMDWKGIGTSFYSLACAIGDYASLKYKLDVSELEKGNKKPFYRLVHRWAEASKNTALMKSYHFSGNEPFTSDDERMRSCLIEHCLKMAEAYVICVIGGAGAGKTQILTGYARMLGKILYDNGLRVEEKYCDPELIPEGRTYDEPEMQYKFLSGFSCHAFAAAAEGTSDGVLMPGAYDSEATREFPTTYPIHKPNTPIKQHAKTSSERNFPEFGVFLLDEVTNATQSQLTAVFKLAEEAREINGYKVPAGWIVIMAGNGREYNNYTAFPQALI